MVRVTADVEWEGDTPADLARDLDRFGELVVEEVNRALEDLALMVEREAKQRAPVDTGTLRASIGHVVEQIGAGFARAVIGTNVEYAPEVEFGTGPHTITGTPLRFTADGETVFATTVQHPGTPAQPFLGPALHAVEDDINDRLREAVRRAERRV
ncbi:phage protein, HK97 gp10 family [Halogeometricum rufum]|uniref:Phage protein, HK97 gp10 family n=1 Tax=Halogeometricum rufum TaxID=553469 RepID=A0A1I6GIU2_9EURY|nr:HK97-gp10 family putative phage morphogenesis protein [Halogeometricum rufum]SFR42096.1 phage protein, HK97 gp10 family [Halogeometricum rufum]